MSYQIQAFGDSQLTSEFLQWLIESHWPAQARHYHRLWSYYSNPSIEQPGLSGRAGRRYIQAQEIGLPTRITALQYNGSSIEAGASSVSDIERKEVVIENDISWRVNAIVDFLFGKPVAIRSKSPDARKSQEITEIIKALFSANGSIGFFQDLAVLGSVYGFVDCLIRPGEQLTQRLFTGSSQESSGQAAPVGTLEEVLQFVQTIALELIEAPRVLPVLDENDYRQIRFYVQHFYQKKNSVTGGTNTFISRLLGGNSTAQRTNAAITEIISPNLWQRYESAKLIAQGDNPLGFIPVVHIQNIAQPYFYEGVSDVEPLIALQDELNTRLCDRANRITFQSFKMYLGRGIEGFEDKPVSPGRMWYTDNPEASIDEFGGDAEAPSEDLHISEIREAMDKTSGVTPLVAGVIRGRLGNLTSAVALQLTLMGMLSRNQRKQFTYGQGIKRICSMVLDILDKAGVYQTAESERDFEINFANPLPQDTTEILNDAKLKLELGIPAERVLQELGY